MRALQALVIILGILLLAGTATIAVTLVHRLSASREPASAARPARLAVAIPAGAQVTSISGAGDRLMLHVAGPDRDEILVVDLATGKVAQTVELTHASGPAP